MIDIHTHLLPGVDDGSPTMDHSTAVIERMAAEGIGTVVCTPHLRASQAGTAPVSEHLELLDGLRARAPTGIRVLPGWEIMLDVSGPNLTSGTLSLGGSNARLVEFSRRGVPAGALEELLRLRTSGVVPVVAHPERYVEVSLERMEGWREVGAVLQVDVNGLLVGDRTGHLARGMLSQGLIDVLASDNHGDRRSLSTVREWLREIGASDQAVLLTEENPRRLLENAPLVPVPPVHTESGLFVRLRDLFKRRRRDVQEDL